MCFDESHEFLSLLGGKRHCTAATATNPTEGIFVSGFSVIQSRCSADLRKVETMPRRLLQVLIAARLLQNSFDRSRSVLQITRRRFFANACPEPDFKYISNETEVSLMKTSDTF